MHVRTTTVVRGGKTYRYAQLVESFRRPEDGMPAHRVIAPLGDPDSVVVKNLSAALAAAKTGKRVALVARQPQAADLRPIKPTASLRYLDLAVLHHLWRDMGLGELLDEVMPRGEGLVSPGAVVAALVLQRCVDPGSKLYASRWVPRSALPELLGLAPGQFNNTRIHRALDDLDDATLSLMARLPRRYRDRDVAFASLFVDVSDTWFVGDGPSLASRGKTKEGRVEQKIGLVLLCNQDGLPLRWEVIAGNEGDAPAMTRMLKSAHSLDCAAGVPIVCDRAMGSTSVVRELLGAGIHFVTAVTKTEFDGYAPTLPHAAFASLDLDERAPRETYVEQAAARAIEIGLTKHADDLFFCDLGIVDRDAVADVISSDSLQSMSPTARAMRLAREIDQSVEGGRANSDRSAARKLGLKPGVANKYRELRRLSEQQQLAVLDGRLAHCTLAALIAVAKLEDHEQRAKAFDELANRRTNRKPASASQPTASIAGDANPETAVRVRAVGYFNPDRFVEQRLGARGQIESIDRFVAKLREKLAAARGRYSIHQIHGLIDRELRSKSLLDAFSVKVVPGDDGTVADVQVTLDQKSWAMRRRYDGFSVVISHPDVSMGAADLCRLYRAKDAVEKDFRIIKSVVELRPVWHRTEAKVRAHVTLCVLALLLERLLQRRLAAHKITETAALELLADCRLNRYGAAEGKSAYTITDLDAEQRRVLRALGLLHLADDDAIAGAIRPR